MNEGSKKVKILLIDDDEMMKIYFRDIFWIHGEKDKYEINVASNLLDAKKIVDDVNLRPDLIFLDVILKGNTLGGKMHVPAYQIARFLEFVSNIKKNKDFSKIKIVLYSGHRNEDFKDALLELGVDGYLVKGEHLPKEIISFTENLHGSNN